MSQLNSRTIETQPLSRYTRPAVAARGAGHGLLARVLGRKPKPSLFHRCLAVHIQAAASAGALS